MINLLRCLILVVCYLGLAYVSTTSAHSTMFSATNDVLGNDTNPDNTIFNSINDDVWSNGFTNNQHHQSLMSRYPVTP